jgi:hypothetical protein
MYHVKSCRANAFTGIDADECGWKCLFVSQAGSLCGAAEIFVLAGFFSRFPVASLPQETGYWTPNTFLLFDGPLVCCETEAAFVCAL